MWAKYRFGFFERYVRRGCKGCSNKIEVNSDVSVQPHLLFCALFVASCPILSVTYHTSSDELYLLSHSRLLSQPGHTLYCVVCMTARNT